MVGIEGYVIVSADGMIADASGVMPDVIKNDADQNFFQSGLDRASAIVHGRHSHEGGPRADRRKRVVVTRQISALAPDPAHPHSVLWNPTGATLAQALAEIGVTDGTAAIIGGTEVFSMFLPLYDRFYLSHAAKAKIPGGKPVFSAVGPNASPEDVLKQHGLKPGHRQDLDPAASVSVVTWTR